MMSNRNVLAGMPVQGPQNMLGQGGGMPQPQGMPPGMPQQAPQGGVPGMPTQEMLDELWRQQPTDSTGAQIEQIVRQSRGMLMPPWEREQQQQQMPPQFQGGMAPRY